MQDHFWTSTGAPDAERHRRIEHDQLALRQAVRHLHGVRGLRRRRRPSCARPCRPSRRTSARTSDRCRRARSAAGGTTSASATWPTRTVARANRPPTRPVAARDLHHHLERARALLDQRGHPRHGALHGPVAGSASTDDVHRRRPPSPCRSRAEGTLARNSSTRVVDQREERRARGQHGARRPRGAWPRGPAKGARTSARACCCAGDRGLRPRLGERRLRRPAGRPARTGGPCP